MAWSADDISIELDDDGTDDIVVTASISTPLGVLHLMAEARVDMSTKRRCLELDGLHMHGVAPNTMGATRLRWLVQAVMEAMDFDEILIRGATRTTGANPGRRPGTLRFTRTRGAGP